MKTSISLLLLASALSAQNASRIMNVPVCAGISLKANFALVYDASKQCWGAAEVEIVKPLPPPLPVISAFSASPTGITLGQSATLSWTVTGSTSVAIDQGIGTVAATGTRAVSPTVTTVYILTATNAAGSVTRSVSVTVGVPPPSGAADIKTYGAKCDGGNDTAAVQAALNSLTNSGTLNFSCVAGITQVTLPARSGITLTGTNGGGVMLLTEAGDIWARAFAVKACSGCTIRDMLFEGNNKDMIAFNIEESSNTTVSGLTIRNVRHAGAAFLTLHNTGNKYLNNTLVNVGMDRGPEVDTTRGMWIGNVSTETREDNVTISGNTLTDISGTAIAVHGSGITVTGNTGVKLNASCVKVEPLGGVGRTLISKNNCSGAGAKYWIGGGMMTEYYNSSLEETEISDNVLEGYAEADIARIPDCPNNGLGIANPSSKKTNNVKVLRNVFRNFKYDGIQVTGPTDNYVLEGNLIERTISGSSQGGIAIQGDVGKTYTRGVIRRNLIRNVFDAINLGGNGGRIDGLVMDTNSIVKTSRDGIHIEVLNGGVITGLSLTGMCYSQVAGKTIWDNRTSPLLAPALSTSCADPR